MTMQCLLVTADGADERRCRLDDLAEARARGEVVWIHLERPEPGELRRLQEILGVHELAIEDAIDAGQRSKIELYGNDLTFVVIKVARYRADDRRLDLSELHLIVGEEYVVTVAHGDDDAVAAVRSGTEAEPATPLAVLHAVMDRVVDRDLEVVEAMEEQVQEVERRVFSAEDTGDLAPEIYDLKRDVLELWHTTEPLVLPLQGIVGRLHDRGDELTPYLRDVEDHLRLVVARSERMRDLLTDALDANIARLSVRQNEDMRKMSAWAALFLLPTVLVGVWGMNFEHMPELDEPWGYPFALTVIVVSCAVLYSRLRRSGWL